MELRLCICQNKLCNKIQLKKARGKSRVNEFKEEKDIRELKYCEEEEGTEVCDEVSH
jgi:hypothetical protein